jgi:DNA-binding response OmpR family regulator
MAKKILILEDEESIRSFVVINLRRIGYEPLEAGTGAEAYAQFEKHPDIQVALLDVMLPDTDGFEVCRRLRAQSPYLGIIILTAKSQEMDKVNGLIVGADDYITKPFSPAELNARIDALIRRTDIHFPNTDARPGDLIQGPFKLNKPKRQVEKNGVKLKLTSTEYAVLKLFMENPGKALSREDILAAVWGRGSETIELKITDVNIRRLRLKIENDPTNPEFITTVWGYGYQWNM